jgi:hypothetical protein
MITVNLSSVKFFTVASYSSYISIAIALICMHLLWKMYLFILCFYVYGYFPFFVVTIHTIKSKI